MGNPDTTDDLDRNKSEFGSQLRPRIWLGRLSRTSILARIENLQRKRSKEKSFDISIESSATNGDGINQLEKSTTDYSATNEQTSQLEKSTTAISENTTNETDI